MIMKSDEGQEDISMSAGALTASHNYVSLEIVHSCMHSGRDGAALSCKRPNRSKSGV